MSHTHAQSDASTQTRTRGSPVVVGGRRCRLQVRGRVQPGCVVDKHVRRQLQCLLGTQVAPGGEGREESWAMAVVASWVGQWSDAPSLTCTLTPRPCHSASVCHMPHHAHTHAHTHVCAPHPSTMSANTSARTRLPHAMARKNISGRVWPSVDIMTLLRGQGEQAWVHTHERNDPHAHTRPHLS